MTRDENLDEKRILEELDEEFRSYASWLAGVIDRAGVNDPDCMLKMIIAGVDSYIELLFFDERKERIVSCGGHVMRVSTKKGTAAIEIAPLEP